MVDMEKKKRRKILNAEKTNNPTETLAEEINGNKTIIHKHLSLSVVFYFPPKKNVFLRSRRSRSVINLIRPRETSQKGAKSHLRKTSLFFSSVRVNSLLLPPCRDLFHFRARCRRDGKRGKVPGTTDSPTLVDKTPGIRARDQRVLMNPCQRIFI